ncbi:MAG: hypothetical protein Q8M96_00740, partial [Rubrivivax sp.]|nr:hypothetical protein [Rubrivivax sp.]
LEGILRRSVELDVAATAILRPEGYELGEAALCALFSFNACELTVEHARATRALISERFDTSAASLLRLRFEAAVRAIWLVRAASEKEVMAIDAEPSSEAEMAAWKILPGVVSW